MSDSRVPEIISTPLTGGEPDLRVPEIVSQPLTGGEPALRVSEIIAEPLTGGNPSLRVALIVSQVLVRVPPEPFMTNAVFPVLRGLSWSVKKKPMFSTRRAGHVSGAEIRTAFYQYPIWNYELRFDWLPDRSVIESDLRELMGFFLQRLGAWGQFLYRDPTDYQCTDGYIGTGDGVILQFPMSRTLGGFSEPVGQVDYSAAFTFAAADVDVSANTVTVSSHGYSTGSGPFTLASDGALPAGLAGATNYWLIVTSRNRFKFASSRANALAGTAIDLTTQGSGVNTGSLGVAIYVNGTVVPDTDYTIQMPNQLVFDIAPDDGDIITADFGYYYVCSFAEDVQDYENFMFQLWNLQSCKFKSIIQ